MQRRLVRRGPRVVIAAWALAPTLCWSTARAAGPDADPPETLEERHRRLTEREDEERPEDNLTFEVLGQPLILSGQYEIGLFVNQEPELDDDDPERDEPEEDFDLEPRLNLGQELELELFYAVAPGLSLFAQGRVEYTQDLYREEADREGRVKAERGEMWLFAEGIADTPLGLEVGRLDFEDDRRWWWNAELDAVRASYEEDPFELTVALARELFRFATDQDRIDPEDEGVVRLLAEASWQYHPHHQLDLFALRQWDESSRDRPGSLGDRGAEDESDAGLTWVGGRLMGELVWPVGSLGYWLDAALVRGSERVYEYDEGPPGRSMVEDSFQRQVQGWGLDLGATWVFEALAGTRVTLGYAVGSGDPDPLGGRDRSFRQSGIQENESRLGGVEGFLFYGELLEPELSNLQIATVGWGISLLESSSLDVVYHHYRLVEPSPVLPEAGIEADLVGTERSVGHELDVILAVEEWKRFGIDLRAAAFLKGAAFGRARGEKEYEGFLLLRYAF